MKNLNQKMAFFGKTILVLIHFVAITMGIQIIVDLIFGQVVWERKELTGDLYKSLFFSIFLFILFDGTQWLRKRKEIFNSVPPAP